MTISMIYIYIDSLSEMIDHDRTCDESYPDISILCLFLFVYTYFKTLLPITSPHSSNTETKKLAIGQASIR